MSLFEGKYSLRRAWKPVVFEGHTIEDLLSKASCVSGSHRGSHDCAASGPGGQLRNPGSKVPASPSPRGLWRIQEAAPGMDWAWDAHSCPAGLDTV